ncbi:MAG TPA: 6,7-dimethyl-8-ribityllumazine synthase [Candidatus Acidoferrum sp.]|nr:6,7-dimethyl-8-ribityllumazine synthase [Candidatus Acidoferrum sp.]
MKWANLTVQAKSEGDFGLLTKMLDALGFRGQEVEEYGHYRLQPFLPADLRLEVVHRKNPRAYPDLELTISDPDSAVEIIRRLGLEILGDDSGQDISRNFDVRLPGGTTISFMGIRIAGDEPAHRSEVDGTLDAKNKTFGIVVSRFNSFITERLLCGCVDGLRRCGVGASTKGYEIIRVPGAFEIPLAARKLAETKKYDAIICLGCLLRGDTAHYDVIVNEVTRGIGQSAQETGVPHAFGVLTCENLEQAIDRAGLKMGNKGFEAALAAVEMASLKGAIGLRTPGSGKTASRPQPATASKKQVPPLRLRSGLRPSGSGTTARSDKAKKTAKTKRK